MRQPAGCGFELAQDTLTLLDEARRVVEMRVAKLARGGPDAGAETALMITEKTCAFFETQALFATALFAGEAHLAPGRAVSMLRQKVQANQRRLSEGK